MNLHEMYKSGKLKDGFVVVCTWSPYNWFTEGKEYTLLGGTVEDDDGDVADYSIDDAGFDGVQFKMSERFDIQKYEFEDRHPSVRAIDADGDLNFELGDSFFGITKGDAIAIAKHFKLTGDDL